jgi:NADH dehydrogenase (ubiquinone) 1 alpha subcomplex subunit 5
LAAAQGKRVTNIVGYDPIEPFDKAKGLLVGLYQNILSELEQIPPTAGYRQIVEATTKHRLQIVQAESTYEGIETKIGTGLVEELVEQAQDELKLIGKVAEWKPWELPAGSAGPQVIGNAEAAKQAMAEMAGGASKPAVEQQKK